MRALDAPGYVVGALYVRRDKLDDVLISWNGSSANATLDRSTGEHARLEGARRFEFGNRFWPSAVSGAGRDAPQQRRGD
jgi:hypothetical protein